MGQTDFLLLLFKISNTLLFFFFINIFLSFFCLFKFSSFLKKTFASRHFRYCRIFFWVSSGKRPTSIFHFLE